MGIEYFTYDVVFRNNYVKLGIDISSSWCFGLYICPQFGLYSLKHWLNVINIRNIGVVDQFGCRIMPDIMERIITDRSVQRPNMNFDYEKHNAEIGPNNLIRRKITRGYCIGHEGTIDYLLNSY